MRLPGSDPKPTPVTVGFEVINFLLWIADIVRSAKKIRSINLVEELDALCDVLENAEHNHARVRGVHVE